MILPISTDRPLARPTLITYALIALCVLVHVAGFVMWKSSPDARDLMTDYFMLNPAPGKLTWFGFITYQFLHADFMHLLGNMLFLYVFGPAVEDRLGRWWFLLFYLVGGAASGFAHLVFASAGPGMPAPPVIGASGAISCVTGAYLVLFPKATIRVLLFFFVIGVYHIPAWLMIVGAIVKDVWFSATAVSNAVGTGEDSGGGGVAFAAHVGGYVFGASIALILLATKLIPREQYDLFSMGKQAHRRRLFKELASSGKSPWMADAPVAGKVSASTPTPEQTQRILEARGAISRALTSGNLDEAATLYAALLDQHADAVLPRGNQLDLANHYAATGRQQTAAVAYELFIKKYSGDREMVHVKLMLALINARYLNDPTRAKALLHEVNQSGPSEAHRRIVDELAAELG